jgi:hypothetical protein
VDITALVRKEPLNCKTDLRLPVKIFYFRVRTNNDIYIVHFGTNPAVVFLKLRFSVSNSIATSVGVKCTFGDNFLANK